MNRECISYERACELLDSLLDEEGPVRVSGICFDRSRILREMDPHAYRSEVLDYADACGYDIMEYEV
jgi:hypothetical protein